MSVNTDPSLRPAPTQRLPEADALTPPETLTATLARLSVGVTVAPEIYQPDTYAEGVVSSGNQAVAAWAGDLFAQEVARVRDELDRSVPWHVIQKRLPKERRSDEPSDQTIAIAAAAQVEKKKRAVLTEAGLTRCGDPPFDYVAQLFLPDARAEVKQLPDADFASQLDIHLRPTGAPYKRVLGAAEGTQREELAWSVAKNHAQNILMGIAARDITREELDTRTAVSNQPQPVAPKVSSAGRVVSVLDADGGIIPSSAFFPNHGRSPFTIAEWCALPTRPVVSPAGKPERGINGLATYVFDNILYNPQVCDRNGQAVGLSPAVRQRYIDRIAVAMADGRPVSASQYMPVIAIGNPIKRNTQAPTLAEIDVFRRLVEITQAVEAHYPPGMSWLIGNEAPAFQGPGFGLAGAYVNQFHDASVDLASQVDPTGQRLTLFDEADILWGTPLRSEQWKAFEAAKDAELREAYANPAHPEHDAVTDYINTYIYPMATCTDPYKFESGRQLSVTQIAEVYAALKASNRSVIRGVGAVAEGIDAPAKLSETQQTFLVDLKAWALDLTFQYRVAMESRDILPAFGEIILPHTIAFTMVTKREKAVLFPNSGRGAYFPAHGEAVLLPAGDDKQRTAVTVRPWWQIASQPESYRPMHVDGRQEPLYFTELA